MKTEGENGGSDLDSDEEKEDLNEKLKRLYDVKDDLHINLKAVEESLAELGYTVDTNDVKVARRQAQTGIRIGGKLSFRGKQMAAEYFAYLDEDKDGYLGWADLRAMRSLAEGACNRLGLVHEPAFLSWESWRMFMDDAGIKTDEHGRINLENFVKLRELIEMKQPLARELKMVELGFLPPLLKEWSEIKTLVSEVMSVRSEARAQDSRGLNYDEAQYVLANAGIVFTRPEFFFHMVSRALREKTMESLLLKNLKKRYAGSPSKYAQVLAAGVIPQHKLLVEVDDIKYTKVSQLTAWLYANRPQETKKGLYRNAIICKWRMYRWIRYVDLVTRTMFNLAITMRHRKVFEDFLPILKLSPRENEKTQMNVEVDILGRGGNVDEGMGVEWSLTKLDDPEQYLMRQRLPRDSGFTIYMDFMLRSEVKHNDVKHTVDALSHFIKHHFDAELKRNVQFRGIYVLTTKSEADGSQVLRIAVCYKRIVSLDAHFEQMLIPYCLNDLITVCTGSLKTSASFADIMVPSAVFQLDTAFTARFELIFAFRKFVVQKLLRRLYLCLSAGYTERQVRPDSEDANEVMRRKLREFFPWIMERAKVAESWLRGHKTVDATLEFKILSDLLSRLGSFHPWVKQNLPEAIGSEPGWINKAYQTFSKYWSGALKDIFNGFKVSLEEKAVREEQARKERMYQLAVEVKKDDDAEDKQAVLDKLKRLGIEMDVDDIFAKDAHDAMSMVSTADDRLFRNDCQGMQMLEKVHETVLGLHTVEVVMGKARLHFAFQGVDFMEAVPKPPPTSQMKHDMEERRLAALAK